jgi:hypothetical protein
MKSIRKIIFCTIFCISHTALTVYAQSSVTVTVKDNDGSVDHTQTFKSYLDLSSYHDFTGKEVDDITVDTEIYLHGMAIGESWDGTYFHAKIIHAGHNVGSNGFENSQRLCDECATRFISDDQIETDFGDPEGFLSDYPTSGADLNWYQGFTVCDGCEDDPHFITTDNNSSGYRNGEANIDEWHMDYRSGKSAVVIFRADNQIILSSGFRALNNPKAKGNHTHQHAIESFTNVAGNVRVTAQNHHFHSGDVIELHIPKGTPDTDPLGTPEYEAFGKGATFTVVSIDADHFELSQVSWPTTVSSPVNSTTFSDLGECWVNLAWDPVPKRKAYFHAYTGDRFAPVEVEEDTYEDLWSTEGGTVANFTDPDEVFYDPLGSERARSSKFRKMSLCGTPYYKDRYSTVSGYNADMENKGDKYNPVNVELNASDNLTNSSALRISYTQDQFECQFKDIQDEYHNYPVTTRQADQSPGGIGTDLLNSNHCSDEAGYLPLYTLHHGKVKWVVRFDKVSGQSVALWSYHNLSDNTEVDGSTTNNGFNPYGNCKRRLTEGDCWKNDYACGGIDEIDNVDYYSHWFNYRWKDFRDQTGFWNGYVDNISTTCTTQTYSSVPGVQIASVNGKGSGADAHVVLSNGSSGTIQKIVVDARGSGYTVKPSVTISGCSSNNITVNMGDYGEEEVYHFKTAVFSFLPYEPIYGGVNAFTVNFTQIPGNTPGEDGKSWKSFSDEYHTIAYEWLPGEIRFLIGDESGENMVEVSRTTRDVPKGHGVNLLATNQLNKFVPGKRPNSDMFIKQISAQTLNPNFPGANKLAPTKPAVKQYPVISRITLENIIPNPTQNNISFEVSAPEKTGESIPMQIELFNALGQLEGVLFDAEATMPSKHSYSVQQFPSGSYYIRVSCGNTKTTKSFVIQR